MSLTMYAGAALTVAAKFDMNAASSPAISKPNTPGGHVLASARSAGASRSRACSIAAQLVGMKNASASTVMPVIIMYRGK